MIKPIRFFIVVVILLCFLIIIKKVEAGTYASIRGRVFMKIDTDADGIKDTEVDLPDVGLFAEYYDPSALRWISEIGVQAFTHYDTKFAKVCDNQSCSEFHYEPRSQLGHYYFNAGSSDSSSNVGLIWYQNDPRYIYPILCRIGGAGDASCPGGSFLNVPAPQMPAVKKPAFNGPQWDCFYSGSSCEAEWFFPVCEGPTINSNWYVKFQDEDWCENPNYIPHVWRSCYQIYPEYYPHEDGSLYYLLRNINPGGSQPIRINCGLGCGAVAHRWKPFFRQQFFDWLQVNYPDIYGATDTNDFMKGGGSFQIQTFNECAYDGSGNVRRCKYQDAFNWENYTKDEYYMMWFLNSTGMHGDYDFEWIPPTDSPYDRPEVTSIINSTACTGSQWVGGDNTTTPFTVTATFTDEEGGDTIEQVYIGVADDEADNWGEVGCGDWERNLTSKLGFYYYPQSNYYNDVVDYNSGSGCPWDSGNSNINSRFEIVSINKSVSGNNLTVTAQIRLKDGSGSSGFPDGQFKWFGLARDNTNLYSCSGNPLEFACHDEAGDFWVDLEPPTATVFGSQIDETNFQITWSGNDSRSGLKSIDRDCGTMMNNSTYPLCSCGDNTCYADRDDWDVDDPINFNGSQIDTIINPTVDSIRTKVIVEDNACNINEAVDSVDFASASSWLMTGHGDVYVHNGFNPTDMVMYNRTDLRIQNLNIPTIVPGNPSDNPSYFSQYLIGTNTNPLADNGSFSPFEIQNYNDENRTGFTGNYDYLIDLVNKGGCTIIPVTGGTIPACSGSEIFAIEGSGSVSFPGGASWGSPNTSCVVLSQKNLTVPTSLNDIYGFIITTGSFTTQSIESDPLIIHGSVIANNVTFNRTHADNNANPSEVISYEAKYLDLLRQCFGEFAPKQVREVYYNQ